VPRAERPLSPQLAKVDKLSLKASSMRCRLPSSSFFHQHHSSSILSSPPPGGKPLSVAVGVSKPHHARVTERAPLSLGGPPEGVKLQDFISASLAGQKRGTPPLKRPVFQCLDATDRNIPISPSRSSISRLGLSRKPAASLLTCSQGLTNVANGGLVSRVWLPSAARSPK
jgi:hypothetical protein